MFNVNPSDAKTKHIATHLDPQENPADLECLINVLLTGRRRSEWWDKSAGSARYEFRTVRTTLIQGSIVIWGGQVVVDNTKMEPIYFLEAVGSALPTVFPGTGP